MEDFVELYEDNAGQLFLRYRNTVWAELELLDAPAAFADDAAALFADDTDDWTILSYPVEEMQALLDEEHPIAVCERDGTVTVFALGNRPMPLKDYRAYMGGVGLAGLDYLGVALVGDDLPF